MEFHEKLQQLRKQKGLTQEELARALYVSRTAVSKWESGRGIPSIESLKSLSEYFSVSLDDLLSSDDLAVKTEMDDQKEKTRKRDLIFGALDCSMALLLFLPLFGQRETEAVQAVSLLTATGIQPYLRSMYIAVVAVMMLFGVLSLALQSCGHAFWVRHKYRLSLSIHGIAVFLFIISRQPYAAVFAVSALILKALVYIKRA